MNHIEVVNLTKYQPHYTDGRKMIWVRWDISSMYDFKIVSLPVDGKWLFLTLICMASETNNNIPNDDDWLSHVSGVPKNRISSIISLLQTLGLVVTKCDKMSQNVPTDRQTDEQTERPTKTIPPLLTDVKKYIIDNKYGVNAENFVDFYESKGWMIGRNKMKDWKAAVRTWQRKDKTNGTVEDYMKGKERL